MKDYEIAYESFWKEIIEDDEGNINKDQLMRELYDFRCLLLKVPLVYDHVTGGAISKPQTCATVVCNAADEHYEKHYEWLINED